MINDDDDDNDDGDETVTQKLFPLYSTQGSSTNQDSEGEMSDLLLKSSSTY